MAKTIKKRIEVTFTEKEWELIKWMARRDNCTTHDELKTIFQMEFDNEFWLYKDELEDDR